MPHIQIEDNMIGLVADDKPLENPPLGLTAMRLGSDGSLHTYPHGGVEGKVGGNSFSDYENIIVVDSGGNGDFTTLKGAMDSIIATPTGDQLVLVMSSTVEVGIIPVPTTVKTSICIPGGVTVNLGSDHIRTNMGCDLHIYGGGTITSDGAQPTLYNDKGANRIELNNISLIHTGGAGIAWEHSEETTEICFCNCTFQGAAADLLFTAAPNSGLVWNCRLIGSPLVGSVAGAWVSADIYNCYFTTAPQAGFTFNSGTTYGTNIVP